jgi:hypothetical protein
MKKLFALTVVACLAFSTTVYAGSAILTSGAGSATVYGPLNEYKPVGDSAWGTGIGAVETWVHGLWPTITDAKWISNTEYIADTSVSTWRLFEIPFTIPPGAYNITASAQITADNAEEVYLNGTLKGSEGEIQGPFTANYYWNTIISYNLGPDFLEGENTISIIVRNYGAGGLPTDNPTGLIYKITIAYDEPLNVDIDIKPGSYPNAVNINGNGVVPVAILGSADLDVTQIDSTTLLFAGLSVKTKKNGTLQCSIQDVSGDFTNPEGAPDGYPDLVCQFVDEDYVLLQGDGTAAVTGELYDGTPIQGSDTIKLVNE